MYNDRRITAALMIEELLSAMGGQKYNGIRNIRAAGFRVLGQGCYGTAVLSRCETFVVKVCLDPRDGYPLYARFCKDNPQPHLPEVFHIAEVDDMCFVALPMYEELDDAPGRESFYSCERDDACVNPTTSFRKAVKMVRDMFHDVAVIDMHMGNFMWDAKRRQCIITDPISGILYPDRLMAAVRVSGHEYKYPIMEQLELDILGAELQPAPLVHVGLGEWFIDDNMFIRYI